MGTDTIDDIGRRVTELLDRDEIAALVHRLGAGLDEARFDDLRSIFVTDASATTPGGTARGIDAMIDQARRNHPPTRGTQHVITDVIVDLDGDEAAVRANLVVTFALTAGRAGKHGRAGQVYRFGARRSPDGWRLTGVRTTPVWTEGDLPVPA